MITRVYKSGRIVTNATFVCITRTCASFASRHGVVHILNLTEQHRLCAQAVAAHARYQSCATALNMVCGGEVATSGDTHAHTHTRTACVASVGCMHGSCLAAAWCEALPNGRSFVLRGTLTCSHNTAIHRVGWAHAQLLQRLWCKPENKSWEKDVHGVHACWPRMSVNDERD